MRVDWSDLALDDLDDIVRYIAKDSLHYAREFAERIFATSDRLNNFPYSGRYVPEAANEKIREVIVQSYRVIYRTETDRLLVLAVIHGSRDLGSAKNAPWITP
jgi:plasmid stabilization system protein ParE